MWKAIYIWQFVRIIEGSEMGERFIIEVEPAKPAKDGKPSVGPVYRSLFAKDGFPPPVEGLDSCWDIFR